MSNTAEMCDKPCLQEGAITTEIDVTDTDLPSLLAKVETDHEIILSRGAVPVATITRIAPKADVEAAIDAIWNIRAGLRPTTIEEILVWRDEGRR